MLSEAELYIFTYQLFITLFLNTIGVIVKELYTKLKTNNEFKISIVITRVLISIIMGTALSLSILDVIKNPKLYFTFCIFIGAITFDLLNVLLSIKLWIKLIDKFTKINISEIVKELEENEDSNKEESENQEET